MEQYAPPARIVFDISHSFGMRDRTHPDGILRVERNLALHALRNGPGEVRFCRYDRPTKRLRPIGREEAEAVLTGWKNLGPASAPDRSNRARFMRFLRRNRRFIKGWPVVRTLVKAYRRFTEPEFDLSESDIYVNVGPAWDSSDVGVIAALKRDRNFRAVFFVYDLIPILFPHFFHRGPLDDRFGRFIDGMAACADKVICDSDHTRDDLARHMGRRGEAGPDISVLICGSDLSDAPPAAVPEACAQLRERGFVLAVGTVEIRKNHRLLYNIWARFVEQKGADVPPLVIAGGHGWHTDDLLRQIRADPRTRHRIKLMKFVSEAELAWLYENCLFTVFPSLYEGWGLPVVESLARGKYCLASSAASLPQAGQGLIKHIDPLDFAAWYAEIDRLIADPAYLADCQRKVAAHFRPRSWQEAGDDFLSQVMATARRSPGGAAESGADALAGPNGTQGRLP